MSTPKVSKPDVCIYHDPCSDGFASAWACHSEYGDAVEYIPGNHEDKESKLDFWLEKVTDKNVVIYDFSFEAETTKKIAEAAASLQIIDHHASARKSLSDLDYCYFDLTKSGAMLAWESCHEEPPPQLIQYVQDGDLNTFELQGSHAIYAYINSQPRDFSVWDQMARLLETAEGRQSARALGRAMVEREESLILEIAEDGEEWQLAGHTILATNAPRVLRSNVCEKLGKLGEYPFVGCYTIREGKVTWSLRSNRGTEDVSLIAGQFEGGGGHPKAAGFTVPVDRVDFEQRIVK